MTNMMDKNEIEQRIKALKATAFTDGAENTYGLWVLLQENETAKKKFPGAICLRELLGISEVAIEQHLGERWRKQFTTETCGFIHRKWKGCTFISVQTGDENDCNVPCDEYIISRGDVEVEAIQLFMEKIVTSSKEDGASADAGAGAVDEDAVDTEENNITIGGMDGKLLRIVYDYFSLHDIRRTFANVNNMWRQTAKDVTPSPDDYLTTLEEGKIPCVIEFLGQQKDQVSSLEFIFTLVRQNTNVQNAISDVRVQQRVAAARQEVVDGPTIENCTRLLNCALDECEAKGKPLPLALQSMTRRILLLAQQQQLNEESNVDEEQPRRKQQKGVIKVQYLDTAKKTKTMHVQVKTITRSCKPNASPRVQQQHIRRITKEIDDEITERLGVNDSDDNRLKVLQQLAKINNLAVFDSSKMVFSLEECFTLLNKANLSINQLCIVASFIRHMRPDLKGVLWPNQLKKGLCDLIGEDLLEFIVKQLPLITSKKEDKWANRAFWYLTRPAELAQLLLERTILDGTFEDSNEFSLLEDFIVVVWGIDKADTDTAASLRVANRRGGNSSRHTQLLAATEAAAECYTNIKETFMSPKYPLRDYLQHLTYDNYYMLVLTIGGEKIKACRCITIQPTPSAEPCTIRPINSNFVDDPITSDDVAWDEPHDNLPHTMSYCDGDVLRVRLIRTKEEITGIQINNPNSNHVVTIAFMIPIFIESLSDADLRAIKIAIHQILGVPSNDYKLNHSLTGICSASAKNPCACCTLQSNKFRQLSEALYRHRNPDSDPPHKDAPLREGTNSTQACHDRIMRATGGGCLPLPQERKREITAENGSCFHPPLIDLPPIKLAHGEVVHEMGGIMNHFHGAILNFVRTIDETSAWFERAKSTLHTVTIQLEEDLSLSNASSQFCTDYKESQRLLREEKEYRKRARTLRKQLETTTSEEESVDQVALAAVESAEARATEAMNAVYKHAQDDSDLSHQIKLRKGNTELKKSLEKYIKGSTKKPFGPGEYCFKAGLAVCGAQFLTQHGGSDLTTDNGMDVMERFNEVATYAEQAYPQGSEEAEKIRQFLELCREVAEVLAELMVYMKSQSKRDPNVFLEKLDKFLKRWDAALPDKEYFLKLHHLIHHVVAFIKRYGMVGRVSAESFEAIHALIAKLKAMGRSQSTLNRIKTTNGKLQTVMNPKVMAADEKYTEKSTGKKRGRYNTTPSTQSTEAAESFEAYDIETYGGAEYIKVHAGEGVILKEYEDIWRMISTSYIPPQWSEPFQSSTNISQEKKRKITSGAELNLN